MKEKEFQKVKVVGVYMANSPDGASPIVFLENEEQRILPIYIGAAEAFSIQTALEKMPYQRPLTHDLLISILNELKYKIKKVMIDDLDKGVFFARIVVKRNGNEHKFDARPSDSLALAIRSEAPVYVASEVMKSASVDKKTYMMV